MLCGLYMDPPEMSRHSGVVEEQRQMHTYIRLLHESLPGFRALMTSARARLIDLSASGALSHSRIWHAGLTYHLITLIPWHRAARFPCYTAFVLPVSLGAAYASATL
jgi:hypothetical protein